MEKVSQKNISNSNSQANSNSNKSLSSEKDFEGLMEDIRKTAENSNGRIKIYGSKDLESLKQEFDKDASVSLKVKSEKEESKRQSFLSWAIAPVFTIGGMANYFGGRRLEAAHSALLNRNNDIDAAKKTRFTKATEFKNLENREAGIKKQKKSTFNVIANQFDGKADMPVSESKIGQWTDELAQKKSGLQNKISYFSDKTTLNSVLANHQFTFIAPAKDKFEIDTLDQNISSKKYVAQFSEDGTHKFVEVFDKNAKKNSLKLFDKTTFQPTQSSLYLGSPSSVKVIERNQQTALDRLNALKNEAAQFPSTRDIKIDVPHHSRLKDVTTAIGDVKSQQSAHIQNLKKDLSDLNLLEGKLEEFKAFDAKISDVNLNRTNLQSEITALEKTINQKNPLSERVAQYVNTHGTLLDQKIVKHSQNIFSKFFLNSTPLKIPMVAPSLRLSQSMRMIGLSAIALGAVKAGFDVAAAFRKDDNQVGTQTRHAIIDSAVNLAEMNDPTFGVLSSYAPSAKAYLHKGLEKIEASSSIAG